MMNTLRFRGLVRCALLAALPPLSLLCPLFAGEEAGGAGVAGATPPPEAPAQYSSAILACVEQHGREGAAEAAARVPVPLSEEAAERARLEGLSPASIPVQEAGLASAINLIASAAGMNFIAPAAEEFPEAVTLSTRVSPWKLLCLLAERYRFTMHFRGGVWVFDREASGALVSKSYHLRHTNLDSYKSSQNSFNAVGAQSQGSEAQSSGGLVFTPQTQKIMDDLRELVGLPPAQLAKDGRMPEQEDKRPVRGEGSEQAPVQKASGREGKVLYLPDANALYVTATRRQHEHVEEYLRIVDKPVRQIRIEARFFETIHDPKLVLGLDPSGYQPNLTMSNISTQMDLGRVRATAMPDRVLLGADTLRFQINALQTDDRSKLVNNPTVVVANNREAYFSVGDEEPFVSANSISNGAADGGFGTTQAQVTIRRIGTTINLVPTLFEGGPGEVPRIRLSVRIEVGVLKGFRRLNTVDVPVVTSQKYEYTVFLRAGETLAFGGLAGTSETESVRKVPLAGDIPILGHAFRSRSKQSTQRNLVAYLSASIATDSAEGAALPPAGAVSVATGGGR
jgi:hypothetical protein